MKIDSHHHLWSYSAEDFGWITPSLGILKRDFLVQEYGRLLDEADYDGSVVVQARQTLAETAFLLETARAAPFIKGVVGWVDLASAQIGQQLDGFADLLLVGVRHVAQSEPEGFLLRPEILRGLKEVESRGLVFELLVFPHQLTEAVKLVERFPDLSFVLDHLGKPVEGSIDTWRRGIEPLAEYPRVAVKASGLFSETSPCLWDESTIRYLLDTAFDLFGPHRVLASSNWPVSELAGSYGWVMHWLERYVEQFPEDIQTQILGENAVRIYGLNGR